jgi:hypothetical protein
LAISGINNIELIGSSPEGNDVSLFRVTNGFYATRICEYDRRVDLNGIVLDG